LIFRYGLSDYLVIIPAVFISLTVHELSHGLVAYWMGDNTAKDQGRLTLNPLAHIDIMGLICMVIAGFGWAKPVPVNAGNFKNRKVGMALTAFAGPVSNVLLSFVLTLISIIFVITGGRILSAASSFLYTAAVISAGFAVFNLIPLPPLDGSKLFIPLLPNKVLYYVYKYEDYIRLILLAAIIFGLLDGVIYGGRSFIMNGIFDLCEIILRPVLR